MRRRMLLAKNTHPVGHYLRVTPVSVQWVTTTIPVEYDIESNTDWRIDGTARPYLMLDTDNVHITNDNLTAEIQVYSNVSWDITD